MLKSINQQINWMLIECEYLPSEYNIHFECINRCSRRLSSVSFRQVKWGGHQFPTRWNSKSAVKNFNRKTIFAQQCAVNQCWVKVFMRIIWPCICVYRGDRSDKSQLLIYNLINNDWTNANNSYSFVCNKQ